MSLHLEETLQRDFERIRELIGRMGELAVRALGEALAAFESSDRQRAALLVLRDRKIDEMQRNIDRLCLEFLVRHQPVGAHLRFVYAAILVSFELERVGDYAESLARQTLKLADLGYRPTAGIVGEMAPAAIAMLKNAVTAFTRQDPELASATAQVEEQIDQQRNQVNSELLHLVQTGHLPLAALTPLMTVARRFERVSDQAKSICQETIYICTGQYAMHAENPVYRVLFVDRDHGAASRIAEGIGRALGRADFEFGSAGIHPHPAPESLDAYLRQKGLPAGPAAPRGVGTLQEVDVVIALSPGLAAELPAAPRKAAVLEWPLAPRETDPALISPAGYNAVHEPLARRISDLVLTLASEPPAA